VLASGPSTFAGLKKTSWAATSGTCVKSPKKKPAKKPGNAGNSPARDGWASKLKLAGALGIGRGTVYKYLNLQGAPAPDDLGRFEIKAVSAWITSQGSGNVEGSAIRQMKEEKLRMELDDMKREAALKAGRLVDVKQIEPTIKAMFTELTAQLRQEFEQVLPGKYKGKTLGECQVLNAAAVDKVLLALARGCWSLGAGVDAPGPGPGGDAPKPAATEGAA
jgi:hypothetical protein